jgi:hypothetical protein
MQENSLYRGSIQMGWVRTTSVASQEGLLSRLSRKVYINLARMGGEPHFVIIRWGESQGDSQ